MSSTVPVVSALTQDQVKSLPLVAIVAVVLVGLLLIKIFTSMVMRIITLAVMLTLGSSLYVQRQKAVDAFDKLVQNKCTTSVTFFGIKVDPSDPKIKKLCEQAQQLKNQIPKK